MTTHPNPEIERAAEEVLQGLGIVSLPIDPLQIAQAEGIALLPGDYDDCFDGRIEYRKLAKGRRFCLFYAQEGPPGRTAGRVRFSIGHELGHFYLAKHREYLMSGVWHGSRSDFVSDTTTEREADHFAAALLMPRGPFIKTVRAKSMGVCTLAEIAELADRAFSTSLTSTAIRYAQLSPEPCCIVLSSKGRVVYGIPSEDMLRVGLGLLRKDSPVPPTSHTARVHKQLSEGSLISKPDGAIDSDVWFQRRHVVRLWEEVRPLGRSGLVLTLLSAEHDSDDD